MGIPDNSDYGTAVLEITKMNVDCTQLRNVWADFHPPIQLIISDVQYISKMNTFNRGIAMVKSILNIEHLPQIDRELCLRVVLIIPNLLYHFRVAGKK